MRKMGFRGRSSAPTSVFLVLFPALLPPAAAMDGSLKWALTVGALPRKHKSAVPLGKKENIFYCGILFLRRQFRFKLFSEASQIDSLSPDGLLEELRHWTQVLRKENVESCHPDIRLGLGGFHLRKLSHLTYTEARKEIMDTSHEDLGFHGKQVWTHPNVFWCPL